MLLVIEMNSSRHRCFLTRRRDIGSWGCQGGWKSVRGLSSRNLVVIPVQFEAGFETGWLASSLVISSFYHLVHTGLSSRLVSAPLSTVLFGIRGRLCSRRRTLLPILVGQTTAESRELSEV